jgi:hypothetical protein
VRQRERLTRWPVTLQSISIAGAVDNVRSGTSLRRPSNQDDLGSSQHMSHEFFEIKGHIQRLRMYAIYLRDCFGK